VGAGALGSVFGCLLKDAGAEVGLVEPSERLEDIRTRGLTVTGLFGEHRADGFELYSTADQVPAGRYELVLITVKSFHTREAVQRIAPKVGDKTLVLSLQNGLGNYEAIRDAVGEHRALAGRVIFGAQIVEPAHARVTVYAEPVMIGSPPNAVEMDRIEQIAQAFTEAGVPSEPTREINKYIWAKILYNCALNPLSALLDVPYGRLLDTEAARSLMRRVVEEVFAVAQAHGVQLFWERPDDYVEILFGRLIPDTAGHFASMAQDLQAGRKTEIDALNGAIAALGEQAGVECPTNRILAQLITAAEARARAVTTGRP